MVVLEPNLDNLDLNQVMRPVHFQHSADTSWSQTFEALISSQRSSLPIIRPALLRTHLHRKADTYVAALIL
jgi:hypothetical protein